MSFLSPLALLGLLFVPLVLAMYLLKLRRDERVVPSTLLWQRLLTDVEANAPWQRLRRSLLLAVNDRCGRLRPSCGGQPVNTHPFDALREEVRSDSDRLQRVEEQIRKQREAIAMFEGQAVDLEPLKDGEVTTQRPNRKERRSITRRHKQMTGAARELRLAKEIEKRNGQAPLMLTVRSRNGS